MTFIPLNQLRPKTGKTVKEVCWVLMGGNLGVSRVL